MAATGGVRAGAAFIELFVNDSQLSKGLQRAAGRLKSFGDSVQSVGDKLTSIGEGALTLGSALAAPLVASVGVFSEMGSALLEASQRTGITVEALSQLQFAAKQSGVEMAGLESSIKFMQKAIAEAAGGSEEAAKNLGLVKLSVEDLKGLSPDKQFDLIADGLGKIKDPAARALAAMKLFGKSGTAIIPLIGEVGTLRRQFHDLGLTMSTEDAKAADELGDAAGLLWDVLRKIAFTVGSQLAPVFKEWAETLAKAGSEVARWLKVNPRLVLSIAEMAAKLIATGAAAIALGTAISIAGGAISTIATVAAAALPLLLSPIGLVTAGIVALGASAGDAKGAFSTFTSGVKKDFDGMRETAVDAFAGIKDAIAAGDLQLAMQILVNAIEIEWTTLVNRLKKLWNDFSGSVSSVGDNMLLSLKRMESPLNALLGIPLSLAISEALPEEEDILAGISKTNQAKTERANKLDEELVTLKNQGAVLKGQAETAALLARFARLTGEIEEMNRKDAERLKREQEAIDEPLQFELAAAITESLSTEFLQASAEKFGKNMADVLSIGVDEASEDIKVVEPTLEAVGSFSARALAGFGGGLPVFDRTAKAGEETAKNTKEIGLILKNNLAFTP